MNASAPTRRPDVAVLISYTGDGGVERMMNNLIAGLLAAGRRVDVLTLKCRGGHFGALPAGARVVALGSRHAALAGPSIVRYLQREQPPVLLAAKNRAACAALRARARSGSGTRVVVRIGNTLSRSLQGRSVLVRWWLYRPLRRWYPQADAFITVSRGAGDDMAAIVGIDPARFEVVPNPVIAPDGETEASPAPMHPWLAPQEPPVILGVGRLTRQKDFATLLRAFARVRTQQDARLVILGEGNQRPALERLAQSLGIDDALALPGFVGRPGAWMVHASVFVLSSAWEGSPNVLTEALYRGTPVVASDCPSGPREILADGAVAPLVPVGDVAAMAQAIEAVLRGPPDPAQLQAAAAPYTRSNSTARYLEVLDRPARSQSC